MAKDYTTPEPASTAEIYRTQLGDDVLSLHPADVLSLHPANNPVGLSIWDEKDPEAYAQVWIDRVRARELRDALSKWLDTTAVPEGTEPAAGVEIMPLLLATMEKTGGCPAEIAEDLSARVEIGRQKYGQTLRGWRSGDPEVTIRNCKKRALQLALYAQKAVIDGDASEAQLYAATEALRSLYPKCAEGAVAVLTQRPVAGISRTPPQPPLTPEDLEAWEDDQRIQYASDGPVRLYRKLSGDKWLMEGSGVPRLLESRVMAAHFFNVATGRDSDAELGAALLIDEPEDWAVELASYFISMKTDNTDDYMEAAAELLDRYCAATSPHQRVKIAPHQTGGTYMVLREDMEPRKLADHSATNAEAAQRFRELHGGDS